MFYKSELINLLKSQTHITHDNQENNTYVNACSVNIGCEFPPIVKDKLTLVTVSVHANSSQQHRLTNSQQQLSNSISSPPSDNDFNELRSANPIEIGSVQQRPKYY